MAEAALKANAACSIAFDVYSQTTNVTLLSANVLDQLCKQSCRNLVAAMSVACNVSSAHIHHTSKCLLIVSMFR